MRSHRRVIAAGLAAAALCACSDALSPSARIVDGTWSQEDEVPGSSNVWTLAVSGTSVTGAGTWSGEACCGGTLSITGRLHADSIYLAIKATGRPVVWPDSSMAIVAVLLSPTEMAAFAQGNPGGGEFRMRKSH